MDAICRDLDSIWNLAAEMYAAHEDDRIGIYRRMDEYLLDLEGRLRSDPNVNASRKLEELKFHLITLAHLYEPDGHPDSDHYEKALQAITDLHGPLCFATGGRAKEGERLR